MTSAFPPFLIYLVGAGVLMLLPNGRVRNTAALLIPIVGAWLIWTAPDGNTHVHSFLGFDLVLMRVDALSTIFGLVFSLAAFLSMLYAWHVRDMVQQIAAPLYAGSAIGAVFAGDLLTLFIFWEGTAIASVFLIWARRTEGA